MKTYHATCPFTHHNTRYAKGARLQLTGTQAVHLLTCGLIAPESPPPPDTTMMKTYRVLQTFIHGNIPCVEGTVLELSGQQAIYLLESGMIALDAPPVAEGDDAPPVWPGEGNAPGDEEEITQ